MCTNRGILLDNGIRALSKEEKDYLFIKQQKLLQQYHLYLVHMKIKLKKCKHTKNQTNVIYTCITCDLFDNPHLNPTSSLFQSNLLIKNKSSSSSSYIFTDSVGQSIAI